VKKLRIAQYLLADKVSQLLKERRKLQINLDESYKALKKLDEVSEKDLKDYLDNYIPEELSLSFIMKELNVIREENFNFMQGVLRDWMGD